MAAFIFWEAANQLARGGLWSYVQMVVHDEFVVSLPKRNAPHLLELIRETAEVKRGKMVYTTKGELYGRHWGTEEVT